MFVELENFIVTLLLVVNRTLLIPWLARKILESILSTKRQLQNTLWKIRQDIITPTTATEKASKKSQLSLNFRDGQLLAKKKPIFADWLNQKGTAFGGF